MSNLLSFDLSTHTGWSYFEDRRLVSVGYFDVKIEDYINELRSYRDIPRTYPYNLMKVADTVANNCYEIWDELGEPNVVTEHTEGSKRRISQRTLEWIHYAFFNVRDMGERTRYLLNSDWRRHTKCYISQWPEFQKWNKEIGKLKKKVKPTKSGARVAKKNGKIVSKVDAKKLSIHIAKLNHPDMINKITTDDIADSINMGDAAIALGLFK